MTDLRKQTTDALEPFAKLADAIDAEVPRYLKKPGAVLISYNGETLTNTHLRQAREAWKLLTKKETKT